MINIFGYNPPQFYNNKGSEQNKEVQALEHEIQLLRQLDHSNIVQYLGTERKGYKWNYGSIFFFGENKVRMKIFRRVKKIFLIDFTVVFQNRHFLST